MPVAADEALMRQSGCFFCHSGDNQIGPEFKQVADRYRNDERSQSILQNAIRHGSRGNWLEISGGVLMPPYSRRLTQEQIEIMVNWISSR